MRSLDPGSALGVPGWLSGQNAGWVRGLWLTRLR